MKLVLPRGRCGWVSAMNLEGVNFFFPSVIDVVPKIAFIFDSTDVDDMLFYAAQQKGKACEDKTS